MSYRKIFKAIAAGTSAFTLYELGKYQGKEKNTLLKIDQVSPDPSYAKRFGIQNVTFRGRSGITPHQWDPMIMDVAPNSTASNQNIRKAYNILAINGESVTGDCMKKLKEAENSEKDYIITFGTARDLILGNFTERFGYNYAWDGKIYEDGLTKYRKHIYLLRHPQYEDADITELGAEQAHLTGIRMQQIQKQMKNGENFAIYSSTKPRAKQMTEIVSKYLPDAKVEYFDDLRELALPNENHQNCTPEKCCTPEDKIEREENAEIVRQWTKKYLGRAHVDATKDEHVIVIGHNNVIRYQTFMLQQIPIKQWIRLGGMNCSLTRFIVLRSGKVILESFGDVGHIHADKTTSNDFDFFKKTIKSP